MARVSLWRHRDFGLFWAGETASQFGTAVSAVALPLVAVNVLAATPWQMGCSLPRSPRPSWWWGCLRGRGWTGRGAGR